MRQCSGFALHLRRKQHSRNHPDLREVAAHLNVEVAQDGAVVVHGIPEGVQDEVGLRVAQVAAQAARARLERILLHKSSLSRDDRRLLTRVARQAVMVQRRVLTAS